MAMILGVCALLGCVLLWVMAKQRADQAEQKLLHLTAKTEHLEQHLSQTLTLIQEITQKIQQEQQYTQQQAARLQQLEKQQVQLLELISQLLKAQQK